MAGGQARLVVAASQAHLGMAANQNEWLLGREDPVAGVWPDVDLSPHGGDSGGVSRQHCMIRRQGAQYTIEDLGSTNYTRINKVQLVAHTPQVLNHGDEIMLGRVILNFYTG